MSRQLSFAALLILTFAVGVLLYRVLEPFLFPLFFAAVLAVLFHPCYRWAQRLSFGRRRPAAALAAAGVILAVMLPLSGGVVLVGVEIATAGQNLVGTPDQTAGANLQSKLDKLEQRPWLKRIMRQVRPYLSEKNLDAMRTAAVNALAAVTKAISERTLAFTANALTFLIGMAIMALALYYFFADGERMLGELQRLSPFETRDELVLFQQFGEICRGVVVGTVVAAVAEGALAGVGYAIVGMDQVWLLALATMLCAFIPFVGAAAGWGVVTIILLFEQRYGAAIFLGLYGAIIVSGADNLVRAYVIHGRTQMHPLVALVTVLGGIQAVGLWGVFLGPMVAAIFYALLNILQPKLSAKAETDAASRRMAAINREV